MGTAIDTKADSESPPDRPEPPNGVKTPMYDLIELFFFAYRDFVGDADRLLENYGFGRAHHRVLHFVSRAPGLTIAELLEILKITKQSLNRVLKELITEGFIDSRAGAQDRRHRQLFASAKGERLARDLAQMQTRRFSGALDLVGPDAREQATAFLLAMVDAHERDRIAERVGISRPRSPLKHGGAGGVLA
jgi:DNA-binding MarR family transcriptional regulator